MRIRRTEDGYELEVLLRPKGSKLVIFEQGREPEEVAVAPGPFVANLSGGLEAMILKIPPIAYTPSRYCLYVLVKEPPTDRFADIEDVAEIYGHENWEDVASLYASARWGMEFLRAIGRSDRRESGGE